MTFRYRDVVEISIDPAMILAFIYVLEVFAGHTNAIKSYWSIM